MQLFLCILLILALAIVIYGSYLFSKQNALWWKCSWHKTEYWYSGLGHTQTWQPWHIADKDISHGCCKACRTELMKGLWEP